jgi:hypothetical protein
VSKTISFTIEDEHGVEQEYELPAKYDVCDRCEGHGRHSNPSIDGNGITGSEWEEWAPEERETYLSGGYDVTCEECNGLRVTLVIDEAAITHDAELKELYDRYQAVELQRAQWERDDAHVRRMESGGYW